MFHIEVWNLQSCYFVCSFGIWNNESEIYLAMDYVSQSTCFALSSCFINGKKKTIVTFFNPINGQSQRSTGQTRTPLDFRAGSATDPCYFYTGKLTRQTDVYAFGVVLLEVLSGKKAVDSTLDDEQWGLAGWAQRKIKQGKLDQIIDPRLIGQISRKCLKEFARIASRCLHTQPKQRPAMAGVVMKLESILSQEMEIANSVVDEEGFVYKLRSLFTGRVNVAIESKSDFIARQESILIEVDGVIGSNTDQSVLRTFTYAELKSATNGFEKEVYTTTLTECIYKGWVAEKTYAPTKHGVGLAIYVRRMEILEWQRIIKLKKFNPNIGKLLGYCLSEQELFCVYEFIPETSLDEYLYGEQGTTSLSWVERLNIAIGAAEGLFHSHKRSQPAYIQFKTSLILVDMDLNARLSDFAFDSYMPHFDRYYAAPEWFRHRADTFDSLLRLSPADDFAMKNEIYAFGVVLLEMLTGMKVYDERRPLPKQNLVEWATPLLADEMNLGTIIDPQLQHNDCPPKGAFKLAQIVSNCLQPDQDERPSMRYNLQALRHCYREEIIEFDS